MIKRLNTKIDDLIMALDFLKVSDMPEATDYKEIYKIFCQVGDDLNSFRLSLDNFDKWIEATLVVFKEEK